MACFISAATGGDKEESRGEDGMPKSAATRRNQGVKTTRPKTTSCCVSSYRVRTGTHFGTS